MGSRIDAESGSSSPFTSGAGAVRDPSGNSSAGGWSVLSDGNAVTRGLLLVIIYSGTILVMHWLAYLIRFEFHPPAEQQILFWQTLKWELPLELLALLLFGQFRSLLSYFSLPDARHVILACASASLVSLAIWDLTHGKFAPPRSIIVLGFILDSGALGCVRIAFRVMRERQRVTGSGDSNRPLRRIIIIGAGDVGANLAKEMKLRPDLRMYPIAFLDDDRAKWSTRIHGVTVIGRPESLSSNKLMADEAVIAMPSASGRRIREVVQLLNEVRIPFETVPSMEQMVNGEVKASQIRSVQLEDLLGRDHIDLETGRILELLKDKVVMVTGAGGSIGSELCRQIVANGSSKLLLIERCEVQIFQIEQELLGLGRAVEIVPLVADILDCERMRGIFERHRPQIVFHAAAHKHVPMMEHQPGEAFRNNTIGTKKVANLAVEFGVERFVLISTDKAINPSNVMGATKRLAELYIQALQKHSVTRTRMMAVRFGNVLGSSGSVIPTFKRQIAAGGPVTVTDPSVTRFFMTVQEAVGLVLQSATQGQGGEIFVLDMGKLVKIVDVARQLIELSGLKPDIDVEIKFTGLRPGEKLFEELNYNTENMVRTEHPKIMRFTGRPLLLEPLRLGLLRIYENASLWGCDQMKLEIQKVVPEYTPQVACFDGTPKIPETQVLN